MQEQMKQEIYSWIKSLAIAFLIAFLCRVFLFSPTTVHGESMEPTFSDQDRLLISKTAEIERFDMIVFEVPDADEHYVKRVIGLPGDRVAVKDDVLYINGKAMEEPYLESNKASTLSNKLTGDFTLEEITGQKRVPEGAFFVMGDNRLYSKDSRYFGFIAADSVLGEVKFRYFPLQAMGLPQ